tara:strand:+ start:18901 stop:20283 length:1383 start_codon:yes stop_codon:yes gene_type:complete
MEIVNHEIMAISLFICLGFFLLFGFPVALTLAGTAILFAVLGHILGLFPIVILGVLPNRIFSTITNETLIAVPLFIFMGVMLEKSGIANSLLSNLGKLWGNVKGGLAYSTLFVGTLMAASTGIVGATVVTMGILSLPLMIKWGYDKNIATGIICASGTLGQIVPPSIVLVLLADILQGANEQAAQIKGDLAPDPVSSIDLFSGAILPGLLLVFFYGIWIFLYSKIKPKSFPIPKSINKTKIDLFSALKVISAPLSLIVIVLGSILFGISTPTEAAALGALGSFLISLVSKKISMKIINLVSIETLKITCMVFFILIGASLFSLVFRGYGGDLIIENFLTNIPGGALGSLLIVFLTIFILGFFLDFLQIIFVIIPLVGPSLISLGFDPIWLGIMIAINIQTSFLTPPFGFALFYLRGVASSKIKTSNIYFGVMPFIIIQIILIVILYKYPEIVTWLPKKIN